MKKVATLAQNRAILRHPARAFKGKGAVPTPPRNRDVARPWAIRRHQEHDPRRRDGYARRAEATALYQTVAEHWPELRARIEEREACRSFVDNEFEKFLKCGIVEESRRHLVCMSCGYFEVVALS
jgi:hypothetical protein